MQEYGLQQPISVRETDDGYHLTSGLRRFSAAQMLGWKTIQAFVRNVTADQAYVVDLVENLQREDLSPEEEADALGELVRARGWTLEQVAAGVKRSVAYVSKRLRVFADPILREAVTRQGLAVSTAEELLAVEPQHRARAVERALAERWDQTLARQAAAYAEIEGASPGSETDPSGRRRMRRASPDVGEVSGERPRGFTRAIRDFHRINMAVRVEDLSPTDRSALRSLFRDLVMLARATEKQRQPVFPPLPNPPLPKSSRASSKPAGSRRPR
jgi:ParB/RepB/Spo0J family partition protein